jgi:sugar/nucleoside kinase (ribokinase family)
VALDVLVLGGAGVDTIVYVPELPLSYADSYLVPAIEARPGQTGDNVALNLRALGLNAHLMDLLGDDHEGRLVRGLHDDRATFFHTFSGTKRAVNLVDPSGRRLSLYDISRGHETERLPQAELAALAGSARHVHVSITHPCQHALETVASSGATISTDLHNWDGLNPYHEQFAYAADVVFMSATALTDHEKVMRSVLEKGRAQVVIATAGADGGYLLSRAAHPASRAADPASQAADPASQAARAKPAGVVPPFQAADLEPAGVVPPFQAADPVSANVVQQYPAAPLPAAAVDSNGAGDAFVAGFLAAWLGGASYVDSVRAGAERGALACTVIGVP